MPEPTTALTVWRPQRNTIYCMDALELCAQLPPASVDMILTDPPYGSTALSWDVVVPFEPMWAAFKRVIKPRGAVVMTAAGMFAHKLAVSNEEWFKYEWVWEKTRWADFMNAKNRPRASHELILVFSAAAAANVDYRMHYYPQGIKRIDKLWSRPRQYNSSHRLDRPSHNLERVIEFTDYPKSILKINSEHNAEAHPTQKPVALFQYLIKTYTQPGALVFDPFAGSGTTAVAAKIIGRAFICGDTSAEYCELARRRVFPEFGKAPKRKREPEPIKAKVLPTGDVQLSIADVCGSVVNA